MMLITPSECPVCGEMSLYAFGCEKCWYVSPGWLEYKAQWTRDFLKCWDKENQCIKQECIIQISSLKETPK